MQFDNICLESVRKRAPAQHSRLSRHLYACSLAVLIGAFAAESATATDALAAEPQNAPATLEDIVVTARKVEENMQRVPVAITAFSGKELQRQNAVKVSDVGRMTPGITFRQSSTNPSGLLVSLRGQFQRDVVATLDPSVGIYVDGVYYARSYGLNSDLLDLQSVQILKGPQGTLFGRNTTGGAILLQTNNPQYNSFSGLVSATYGRFNERTATAVLNVPIVKDVIAVRGAFQINKRDGYIRDVITNRKYDNRDNLTGRLKLSARASDNLELIVSAERFRFDQAGQARTLTLLLPATDPRGLAATYISEHGTAGGLTGPGFVNYTAGNPDLTAQNSGANQAQAPITDPPASHYTTQTYSGTATLKTGLGDVKFIGAARGVKGYSILDLDGSPWAIHQTAGYQDLWQYSMEAQLTGSGLGDAVTYATGLFWFKEDGSDRNYARFFTGGQTSASAAIRSIVNGDSYTNADIANKSKGAYAQATWHATTRINITGGLRYSADDRGIALSTTALAPQGGLRACNFASLGAVATGDTCSPVSHSNHYSSVSYLIGTDYRLGRDVMLYAKFSKGYRSGGQPLRATSAANFVPFGPEVVHELEAGVKSELFDRRVRLNLSAYRNTIEGAQRTTLVGVASIYGNAAKVRVWGVEAEVTAVLGGGFDVSTSASLTRPKYLSYTDSTGDRSGERFNGVPREQFSVAGTYQRDIGPGHLTLRADYSWAAKTPLDEYNSPAVAFNAEVIAATTRPAGGEANVRAALALNDGRYELAVFGRNVFNNRDRVAALQVTSFGYVSSQYREPVTYGIQATFRFGK